MCTVFDIIIKSEKQLKYKIIMLRKKEAIIKLKVIKI